jgi:hypothetical protein
VIAVSPVGGVAHGARRGFFLLYEVSGGFVEGGSDGHVYRLAPVRSRRQSGGQAKS